MSENAEQTENTVSQAQAPPRGGHESRKVKLNIGKWVYVLLVVVNLYLAASIIATVKMYVLDDSESFDAVRPPIELSSGMLTSYRVYQELNPGFEGYGIGIGEDIFERTLSSCWVYSEQENEYVSSEDAVQFWGAGTGLEGGSGVLTMFCDAQLGELYGMQIGDMKLIDAFFTEENQIDSGARMLHVSGFEKGDIFSAYTRNVLPYNEGSQYILLADIPLSVRQIHADTDQDGSYGPLKVTIPAAFWVEKDAFAPESIASWGEVDYSYNLECLDDTCLTVRPVFK